MTMELTRDYGHWDSAELSGETLATALAHGVRRTVAIFPLSLVS